MKEGNPRFEPYEGKDPFIFVSYCHQDAQEVVDDIEQLSRLGFRIWYDAGNLPAKEWEESIEDHIKRCRVFMIFASKKSLESKNVITELKISRIVREDKDQDKRACMDILSVFLDKDIRATNFSNVFLRGLECIDRWQFSQTQSEKEYYSVLVKNLEKIGYDTREDSFVRESRTLGLGYLPTLKDVLCDDKKSLNLEEQEERRNRIVFEMHNCTPPIESYHIDNVFQITSEVTQALHNLGELELFKTDPEKPSNLLSLPLEIEQVYVAPLRLITGLITRLDQNWPPLVASYSMLVKQAQMNRLDDLHYYIEFCWLAWGPSVLTTSLFDENQDFMVIQAAFGDEANSLPLIMKKAKWGLIENKLGRRYGGWPVCLKNVFVVRPGADDFFKAVRSYPLFSDVFSDTSQVALYLPHEDKEYDDGEIKALTESQEAFYSTAYVWLMLEQIEQDEVESESIRHGAMEPGKVIPFFEHANLATSKGLDFLQHCLARKAIYHVLDCENDPDYKDRGYYHFATALFPEQMVEILIEKEISRLNKKDQTTLRKRFKISKNPKDWRTPFEVVKFADAVAKAVEECCKALIENSSTVTRA